MKHVEKELYVQPDSSLYLLVTEHVLCGSVTFDIDDLEEMDEDTYGWEI